MPTWRERSIPTCVGLTPPARRRACCTLVHPHVRGAHTSTATLRLDLSGPSPRAWGSRRQRPGDAAPPRSIPTCVGLTGWSGPGSSPPRSIPTCVGLTSSRSTRAAASSVHPHVRGAHHDRPHAHLVHAGPSPRAWGSTAGAGPVHLRPGPSPRAWGSQEVAQGQWEPIRSIPTCVGLTHTPGVAVTPRVVHPHVRGAHGDRGCGKPVARGPSPRAWGSLSTPRSCQSGPRSIPTCVGLTTMSQAGRGKPRSIPTCVGLTSGRPPVPGRFPVHPHVRGAHLAVDVDGEIVIGPSPRAWGSHGRLSRIAGPRRSIPTCVGLTPPAASDRCGGPVHPHVRGAHQRTTRYRGFPQGPSPRAWGSHRGLSGGSNPPLVHPHVRGAHCGPQHRRSAVPGPSPRAWGSQKLTCNFVERYLLVINLAGGFIIQITLDRFQWMRSLATDLSFLCVFKNGCCPLAGVGIHGLSSSR